MEKVRPLALEYTQTFLLYLSKFQLSNCHRLLLNVRTLQTLGRIWTIVNNNSKMIKIEAAFNMPGPLLSALLVSPHFNLHY